MRLLLCSMLGLASFSVFAEGGCPPGQYPIGGQGVVGCAPIPGAGSPGSSAAPGPAGEWETRWGAIVEDQKPSPDQAQATGVAASQKSKRAAIKIATDQCRAQGGNKCEVRITYYNQCVSLADPEPVNGRVQIGSTSTVARAGTLELAREMSLDRCQTQNSGAACRLIYSTCSMSEYKSF